MGIATHTKRLTGWIRNVTSGVVKTFSRLHKGARKAAPAIIEETSEKALAAKKGIFGARRKITATFKRPLSDISHLSIMMVIALALFSGFSTFSLDTQEQKVNPLMLTTTENKTKTTYISEERQRVLEADVVATIAGWHSRQLGADAATVADKLNNQYNMLGTTIDSISTIPILGVSPTAIGSTKEIKKYVVQAGDTLSTIAAKFGISTDTIRYANNIENVDDIKPGVELTILPVTGVLYTVKTGDTLAGIATQFEVTESVIVSTNNLEGVDISDGMQLLIPDGAIPEAPKPVETTTSSSEDNYGSGGSSGSSTAQFGNGNFIFPTVNAEGYYNGYHYWAIDIPGGYGTPIYASDSGRIVEAKYGWNGGFGNTILIDHGNGYFTRYGHMSSLEILDGYVSKGQVIGYMGSTGRSTGTHLHFEILLGGSQQNPCNYFGGCSG